MNRLCIPPRQPHRLLIVPTALALASLCGLAPSALASDATAPARQEARPAAKAEPAADKAAPKLAAKPATGTNLDQLRERLAEKLGATKPADASNGGLMRVTSRLEAPKAAVTAPVAAPGAAPRKPSAAVMAAVDAHRAAKASTAAPAVASAPAGADPQAAWAYVGETGPSVWGGLRPGFATCAVGKRQSPIDIRGGIAVDLEAVQFDYRASAFNVIDNGYTVQVNLGPGNSIQIMGRRYELEQFHFHRPSEERINGRQYEMDVHLVHKDPEGRLAVVAVLLDRGAAQTVVQAVWNNLPLEKGEEQPASVVLDLNHLLPADRGYYTYMGSLTTPPCSEGVLWMVMRQPVTVSQGQIDIFSRLYPMNARPVQSASGRLIKQSQ